MTDFRTRRDALRIGASTLAAGTLAGCLGTGSGENVPEGNPANDSTANGGSPVATSAFPVLGDFAAGVAGDVASVNTLVPVGQLAHGWSPSPQIQREVLDSDLFIYMAEGFQSWTDNIVTNIKNGGTNVTVVEAREGIDLLGIGSAHAHEHGHAHEEGSEHGHESGHGHEHEHGHHHHHGGVNPHFWLDPQRSKHAVENIREGFVTIDGDNAKTYKENAKAYSQQLTQLNQTFAAALKNTPKNVVLVAGHNAYQYLGHEYGFEIEALTGISPDNQPTPKDIAHAQEVIEEHTIEYILTPVLESDRAATTLVQQTDAKGLLPITSIEGMTKEWQQKNWGYIDIMKNVNLPSLKQALGAQ